MGMRLAQCGNSLAFRKPFGRGGSGPGTFLDEEIYASFDGVGSVGAGLADSSTPGFVYAPTGVKAGYKMEGIPVSRAVPMTIAFGSTGSKVLDDSPGCCGVDVGPLPVDGAFVMQKRPDNLTRRHSCHFQGSASRVTPDGTVSGCFLAVALVVDATLLCRCLYRVRSSDTAGMGTNTLVGAVVDSALRRHARRYRTSRACLAHPSHSHNHCWCPRRNRTRAPVLPCARSESGSRKRNARAAVQGRFGGGGTRRAL